MAPRIRSRNGISKPLHAADNKGEQSKPAQAEADVDDVKHCRSLVSDASQSGPDARKDAIRDRAERRKGGVKMQ